MVENQRSVFQAEGDKNTGLLTAEQDRMAEHDEPGHRCCSGAEDGSRNPEKGIEIGRTDRSGDDDPVNSSFSASPPKIPGDPVD